MKKMIGAIFFLFVCANLHGMEDQIEFLRNSVKEIAKGINQRCKGKQADTKDEYLFLHDNDQKKIIQEWLKAINNWDDESTSFKDMQNILDTDKEQSATLRLSSSGSSMSMIFKIVFCSHVKKHVLKNLLSKETSKDPELLKEYPFLLNALYTKEKINEKAKKFNIKRIELYPWCDQIIKYPFILQYDKDSIKSQFVFYAKILANFYLESAFKSVFS